MTTPAEPDWNKVINEILKEMDDPKDDRPVGLNEYHFSQHSKNIRSLEAFDWPTEWIEKRPNLKEFLEKELSDWWEDQLHDNQTEIFRGWLEGNDVRIPMEGYLGEELEPKLIALYRERITETHTCSTCGKEASEKYPFGHPDKIVRLGIPDPEIYPDGKPPKGMPIDDIQWKKMLYCEECWRRDTLKEKK